MTLHDIIHDGLAVLAFAAHAAVWIAIGIFDLIAWTVTHPIALASLCVAIAASALCLRFADDTFVPGAATTGMDLQDPFADDGIDEPATQVAIRHLPQGRDLDFDDYKETDPDWAIHGFRSGDPIEDQRTHEQWERCNG